VRFFFAPKGGGREGQPATPVARWEGPPSKLQQDLRGLTKLDPKAKRTDTRPKVPLCDGGKSKLCWVLNIFPHVFMRQRSSHPLFLILFSTTPYRVGDIAPRLKCTPPVCHGRVARLRRNIPFTYFLVNPGKAFLGASVLHSAFRIAPTQTSSS